MSRKGIVTGSRAMAKISRAGIRVGIALSRCGTDMNRHGDGLIGYEGIWQSPVKECGGQGIVTNRRGGASSRVEVKRQGGERL